MNTIAPVGRIQEFLLMETTLISRLFKKAKARPTKLNGYTSISDFIYRNGRTFDPAKTGKRWRGSGLPNQCFRNAFFLARRRPELIYVEGYYIAGVPIPLPHAWCLMRDGTVIEPTLPEATACHDYFGVPIQTAFVAKIVREAKQYGVLDLPWLDWPVIMAKKSEWKVKLK